MILAIKIPYSRLFNISHYGLYNIKFIITSIKLQCDMFLATTLDILCVYYILDDDTSLVPIIG